VVILPDGGERYLSTPLFAVKERVDLNLFNTLSRCKEAFEPLLPGKLSVFTCGPTAHARVHLGGLRRFLFSDLLCRYLTYRGYLVNHVMNITDFDDKSIEGAEREQKPLSAYTQAHIDQFDADLKQLGVKPADGYPKASEHQEEMIDLAKQLVKNGYAYEKLRSLYFDISRYTEYGRLSGIDINKVKLGATVDLDEYEKDNPRDFTLFKRSRLSDLKRGIYTKTEWGNVRPSWHLQSAALSMKYCGESFDIHASSRELVFPHHENVAAIATAVTGKPLAKYWLDCERVLVDGKKIDESGAGITLQDLLNMGFHPREVRFWLLSTHYRKTILFSRERLEDAKRSLNRLNACIFNLSNIFSGKSYPELDQLLYDIKQGFISGMDDDLNISAALASIFTNVKRVNILMREHRIDPPGAEKILAAFRGLDTVLNVFSFKDLSETPEIQRLIDERIQARRNKDWHRADQIRDQLLARGVNVKDEKIE
jgi:cysteinyl-tRNA synthetase